MAGLLEAQGRPVTPPITEETAAAEARVFIVDCKVDENGRCSLSRDDADKLFLIFPVTGLLPTLSLVAPWVNGSSVRIRCPVGASAKTDALASRLRAAGASVTVEET